MHQSVERLNELSASDADTELLKCCGSTRWSQLMTSARPFRSVAELLTKADELCSSLIEDDWLEAFRAHPKIGEQKAATAQSEEARVWSAQEQSGVQDTAADIKAALAAGNREYEQRFGFIFIVCATSKSSD